MTPIKVLISKSLMFSLFLIVMFSDVNGESDALEESRGKKKKKKFALFLFIADIVIKKIFILKLAYAFVFWVFIHKAGYFLGWFLTYLKEKKEHVHIEHDDHDHYIPHYKEYSPYGDHGGHDSWNNYGPYRRDAHGA